MTADGAAPAGTSGISYRDAFNQTIGETIAQAIRIIGQDPALLIPGSVIPASGLPGSGVPAPPPLPPGVGAPSAFRRTGPAIPPPPPP